MFKRALKLTTNALILTVLLLNFATFVKAEQVEQCEQPYIRRDKYSKIVQDTYTNKNTNATAQQHSIRNTLNSFYDNKLKNRKGIRNVMRVPDLYAPLATSIYNKSPDPLSELTPEEEELSEEFEALFIRAFEEDVKSSIMPFNRKYLEDRLNVVTEKFPLNLRRGMIGEFWHWTPNERIQVGTAYGRNKWVLSVVHELGHSFGLGESLASLFSEVIIGNIDKNGDFSREGIEKITQINNWEYNSIFDRYLLKIVGQEKFWEAAFSGKEEYEKLWNANIKLVSYDELQTARAVAIYRWKDFENSPYFHNNKGKLKSVKNSLKYMTNIFANNNLEQVGDIDKSIIRTFFDATSQYKKDNPLTPVYSHFDFIIYGPVIKDVENYTEKCQQYEQMRTIWSP